MSDNRGRGAPTDEGRIEKTPRRPYENNPGKDDKRGSKGDQKGNTNDRVNDILKKK